MTNTDAERVSDIVPVAWRWKDWYPKNVPFEEKHWNYSDSGPDEDGKECLWEPLYTADIIASYRDAATEQSRIMADIEEKNEALQAQIEAQSKALAEAIPYVETLHSLLVGKPQRQQVMAVIKRMQALTPTPENPNG